MRSSNGKLLNISRITGICKPKEPMQSPAPQNTHKEDDTTAISGTYKDDDSKYSLRNLLRRQETEAGNEE